MLAGDLLKASTDRNPDRSAVIGDDGRLTYAALDDAADRVAGTIRDAGLGKGDRVAICCANSATYAAVYFGSARAGTVLVNLSLRNTARETTELIARSHARLLISDRDDLDTDVATIDARGGLNGFPTGTGQADSVSLSPDDPYCITFTGGTTGQPRGVLVSHRGRAGQAHAIARAFGITADDVVCVPTPMAHIAGLFVCFQPTIAAGATCVLLSRWNPAVFFDRVEEFGITMSFVVPTMMIDVLAHEDFRPERLKSLQRIVYAGAPMPGPVLDQLMETLPWIEFIENYGQSELGALTVRRGDDLPAKRGSIGRAIDGVELTVLGPDGKPVPAGVAGELCGRGPNALLCYDGEPEATQALYKYGGGWIATGDGATVDADGFHWLVERLKDMIIRGGENIYPVEIENILFAHPAVAECAVVGAPDKRLGEVPAAFVVRADDQTDAEALMAFCETRLPRHKVPRIVKFVESLPKTAVGKVRKNVLRQEWE